MFKKKIKKLVYGHKASSEAYIEYLRGIGVAIGEGCKFFAPMKSLVDEQYPWMITIGDNVQITEGVKILTHDYSWSVLKTLKSKKTGGSDMGQFYEGAVLGASGRVTIGSNVFIGMNSIILRGVTVGDIDKWNNAQADKKGLKAARKAAGLTQKQLAAQSGVKLRAIQLYEQNQLDLRRASVSSALALANILNCAIEDLVWQPIALEYDSKPYSSKKINTRNIAV